MTKLLHWVNAGALLRGLYSSWCVTELGRKSMSIFPEGSLTSVRDELEALQLQRLKWTVTHGYSNVPMYTKKFDDAGVHPDDG